MTSDIKNRVFFFYLIYENNLKTKKNLIVGVYPYRQRYGYLKNGNHHHRSNRSFEWIERVSEYRC